MTDSLTQLVSQASALAGVNPCANGHDWQSTGGRACPYEYVDGLGEECFGQTVYECARCGAVDFGDPGGPGFDECDNCAAAESAVSAGRES